MNTKLRKLLHKLRKNQDCASPTPNSRVRLDLSRAQLDLLAELVNQDLTALPAPSAPLAGQGNLPAR